MTRTLLIVYILAHMSRTLKWAFLIKFCPLSVVVVVVVVRNYWRCRQLFTFSSSSPEPLGQFQPNLAQSILGRREFKFFKWRVPSFSKGRQLRNSENTSAKLKNLLLQNQFQLNMASFGEGDSSLFKWRVPAPCVNKFNVAEVFRVLTDCAWIRRENQTITESLYMANISTINTTLILQKSQRKKKVL